MIVGVLALSGFTSVGSNVEKLDSEYIEHGQPINGKGGYTHTVFVEVATSQACPACHYWNQNLHTAYTSGNYDFEYVELVIYDQNWDILNYDAYTWENIYNIESHPTSIFDGDYRRLVGNLPSLLPVALDACGNRAVTDITATMRVSWLGNATIDVEITIQNNEGTQYDGYIRACITEITSRYYTPGGVPFHFGFLDYAFNNALSINPGEVYTESVIWNGNEHADANGDDFGDITPDNIQVTMGVFNDDNGYVDETVMARIPGNNPPDAPTITGPTRGKSGVEYDYEFTATDLNGDEIYYYIEWGDDNVEDWFGPFESGEEVIVGHTWFEKETYTIRAKAKDTFDAESAWGTFEVSMPRDKLLTNTLFMWLLERFPNAFPILRNILEL